MSIRLDDWHLRTDLNESFLLKRYSKLHIELFTYVEILPLGQRYKVRHLAAVRTSVVVTFNLEVTTL